MRLYVMHAVQNLFKRVFRCVQTITRVSIVLLKKYIDGEIIFRQQLPRLMNFPVVQTFR